MKKNSASKKLGIWMDHQSANLMEFTSDAIRTNVIHSEFSHETKISAMHDGEAKMHNKEKGEQHQFYKMIAERIRDYDEVVLFGPTDAKTELHNLLLGDHLFSAIKITILPADKMTENQQHTFVRDFFGLNRVTK